MVKFELEIYRADKQKDNVEIISITRDSIPELVLRAEHAGVSLDEDVTLRYWIYTGSRTRYGEPYNPSLERTWYMKFSELEELAFGA